MASAEPKVHEILNRLADERVAIKTRAGRPKDPAAIPYIQATIDEIEREGGGTHL